MNGPLQQSRTGNSGWLVAPMIGVLAVALIHGALWLFAGKDPNFQEEWGGFLFQAAFIAVPFGVLALKGVNAKTPWIAAALFTAMFWGFFLAATLGRLYEANNMGLLLLILVSPVIITVGALAADFVARRRP